MPQVTALGQRMTYENAASIVRAAGYQVDAAMLTQVTLRSEVAMVTNKSGFVFPILESDNSTRFNTEIRLKQTDVFVPAEWMIRVGAPASVSDAAYKHFSYGNLTVFSTSGAAAAIEGAYANGRISLTIDNRVVVPQRDIFQFYQSPRTQQAADADYTSSNIDLVDSMNGAEDGNYPVQPNCLLAGNANIKFELDTINGLAAIQTNSRWILIERGFLAQNTSKIAS